PQKQSLKSTISQQSPLPKRNELNFSEYQIGALVEKGRELLETSLGQSVIEALKEHESMLIWVKEGFEYHTKEGLTDCLLCGNQIDELRKDLLTKFLDGKMDALLNDVDDMRPACDDKMARINMLSGMIPSENDIIDSQRQSFNEKSIRIKSVLSDMAKAIGQLNELLEDKLNKPTQRLSTESFLSNSLSKACDDEIESLVKDLNEIIKIHNKSHDDFKSLQNSARDKLKKHFLSSDQNAYLEQQKLTEATELAKNTELEVAMNLGVEVERLKQEVRRHGPAAEKMNGLIHNYLGHKELNISTHKEGYELHRNGKLVTGSLSEGEKTAIALCYFLCTLEADNKKIKDLIIVVDDPISSLDTKALNYAFSMLKSFLGKAGQLIILTHNLNFMNEVKKWLKNKTEGSLEDPSKATATLLFLEPVRNAKERASEIKILPKLLREYESEYHYLFHTVLKYARDPNAHEGWVMLIPNAMRKVLDVFLAFKFPGSSGFAGKIEQALSTVPEADSHRVRAIERLVQSESHADNLDDLLTFSTMTIEETEAASKAVLELLKMMDEGHYAQLAKICA
ncbi:MAG: AAA family ATPase, partial [Pseudobdellovibrionaceae bacterium]